MTPHKLWEKMMDGMHVSYEEMQRGRKSVYWQAFAKLKEDVTFRGLKGTYTVREGTEVRVVMASRFGDLGITDDLTADRGYKARVPVENDVLMITSTFDATDKMVGDTS